MGVKIDDDFTGASKPNDEPNALPSPSDPMGVARVLIRDHQDDDKLLTLRYWRGGWMQWQGTHWADAEDKAIQSWLYERLEHAVYLHIQPATERRDEIRELKPWTPNRHKVADALAALTAITHTLETVDTPSWLEPGPRCPPCVSG